MRFVHGISITDSAIIAVSAVHRAFGDYSRKINNGIALAVPVMCFTVEWLRYDRQGLSGVVPCFVLRQQVKGKWVSLELKAILLSEQ